MKALHIISGGDSGGAKTHVFALLDALKKYIDVKIICLIPGVFYQEIIQKDIPTLLIEQKNRFDLSIINQIVTVIKEEQFDLVHVHGARANFIATLIKGKIHVPIISTVHSDYKMDFTDSLYKRLLFTGINTIALRFVDYYIGVSKNFKRMLINRGFEPNKIFTVYNGMDYTLPVSYIEKEEFAKRHQIEYDKDCSYVGIIGRFDVVKGHDVFIKGAAKVLETNPNVRFLLAGEGPEQANLEKLAKELNIENKVHFLGFIQDIYSFIHFIEINTLTSYSESFPYVLLEGAKLKKATISSDVGGISDLIKDGENGFLFQNKDHEEFANKLLKLIENQSLNKKFGDTLYETATTKFSSENLAQKHLKIYAQALSDFQDPYSYDVVMSGYYGFNNSGDDALLYAIIHNLKQFKNDIRILTLSAKPMQTRLEFGVDSKNRFNPISIYKVLKKSRLFLNGGGTLIHDSTSNKSLWYYLTMMRIAKKLGLFVVIYANGYGPFKPKNEPKAAKVTEQADLITLRDDMSYEELRRIGVKNERVHITADPAITLTPAPDHLIDEIFEKEQLPKNQKYMAVSIRNWSRIDKDIELKMAQIADAVYEKYQIHSLFIPMKFDEDLSISKNILRNMKSKGYLITNEYNAQTMMGIISKCELLIGMRLHALIYATTVSVPVIGLVYDPKVQGFLKYINQDLTFDVSNLDINSIKESIDQVLSNKEQIKNELIKNASQLKEKALKNAELTIHLLDEKTKVQG